MADSGTHTPLKSYSDDSKSTDHTDDHDDVKQPFDKDQIDNHNNDKSNTDNQSQSHTEAGDQSVSTPVAPAVSEKQRKALEIAQRLAAKSSSNISPSTLLGKRKSNATAVDTSVYTHSTTIQIPVDSTTDYIPLFTGSNLITLERQTNSKFEYIGTGDQHDNNNDTPHIIVSSMTRQELDNATALLNDYVHNESARARILDSEHAGQSHAGSSHDSADAPSNKQARVESRTQPDSNGVLTQTMLVENDRVGLIIGRGGETIKQLQEMSHCHMTVEKTPNEHGLRIVTLTGTPQQIQHAEQLVNAKTSDKDRRLGSSSMPAADPYAQHSGSHSGGGGTNFGGAGVGGFGSMSGGGGGGGGGGGDRQEVIAVPNDAVGILIGKGGETIRSMQAGSGANIQIQKDVDRDRSTDQRLITLTGTPQQRDSAKQLIDLHITQFLAKNGGIIPPAHQPQPSQYGAPQAAYGQSLSSGANVIKVPNAVVGSIIGKQGETIKRLQAVSGCRIQVSKDDSQPEREITLTGSPQDIERAKVEINRVVEQRMQAISGGGGGGGPGAPGMHGYQPGNMPGQQYQQPMPYGQQAYGLPQQYTPYNAQPQYGGAPPQQQQPYGQAPSAYGMPQQPAQASYDPNNPYSYYSQMGGYQQPAPTQPPVQQQSVSPQTAPPQPSASATQASTDPNADYYNTPEYQAYLAAYYAQMQGAAGGAQDTSQQPQASQYYR